MDPITGAVVAMVLWFIFAGVGVFIFGVGGAILGGMITDNDDGITIGAFVGWILGIGWAIFAIIMAIIQLVRLIQLVTGSA